MRISIFGLGYVGAVSAGVLSAEGHSVIGIDPNQVKVDLINSGRTPIIEKDIGDIIARSVKNQLLSATTNVEKAVAETELSMICVGTPSQANGSLDLTYVVRVCEEIGAAIKEKAEYPPALSPMVPISPPWKKPCCWLKCFSKGT